MQTSLINHAKSIGGKSINKVVGPNGAFISITLADGTKVTLPIGKKSQNSSIAEYSILVADDGGKIVTCNEYETAETLAL